MRPNQPLTTLSERANFEAGAASGVDPEAERLEAVAYFKTIAKHRWLIAALVVLAVAAGLGVAMVSQAIYKSAATLLVEPGKPRVVSIEGFSQFPQGGGDLGQFETQVELLKSREVAERVIRTLQLWKEPQFASGTDAGTFARVKTAVLGASSPAGNDEERTARLVKPFAAALTVEPVGLSRLIRVGFESPDPMLAARVAEQVALAYIQADRDARLAVSAQVNGYLQDRLSALRDKLVQSEQALQGYRDTKGLINLGGSTQTVASQQVGGTNERLVQARTRRAELESTYAQLSTASGSDWSDVPGVQRLPTVVEAQRQLNDAQRRLSELSQTLGSNHVRIQQLQAEVAQLDGVLRQQRQAAAAGLRREYEAARSTERTLERALGSASRAAQDVNREEFQLAALERDVDTNRQLYNMFLSRSKETDLAADVQVPVARITDHAKPALEPIKPNKLKLVAVAAIGALLLGILVALLLEYLDNSVKNTGDAEAQLGLPVLTVLPRLAQLRDEQTARHMLDAPESAHAEAVRTAQTGVMLSGIDIQHKIILVTSAVAGEGKTTFACNLALAHAQSQRTLLIDADMRKSDAAARLGLRPGLKGLVNLVAGTDSPSEVIHDLPGTALKMMPVGDMRPPNPLDLLLSQRLRSAIAALSEQFDVVVIDSPPVGLFSDALVLAPLASSTLVVVRANATPVSVVRRGVSRLQRGGAAMVLAVVNALDEKSGLGYAAYRRLAGARPRLPAGSA